MVHAIARLFDAVLPLAPPASVRCRVPKAPPAARNASGPPTAHPSYIERRRRRSLWLAVVGFDNGLRVIHGVRVGAVR
jgi:hypothetical protein